MKIYQYRCKFLTDIIITADASTEGHQESLDYIPGSKILGIVAGKLYDEKNISKTLDLFHNGIVRYGDALPVVGNTSYLKVPFSWFKEKGNTNNDIYIHHLITSKNIQLKQERSGYFSSLDYTFLTLDKSYSLKSAQDSKNRRSKDGQMFGYESLCSGTDWLFEIYDGSAIYADEIKNIIVGKHRLGRSRSAEFGLVEIKFEKEIILSPQADIDGEIVIYAKSNLCFFDEETGSYLTQPKPEHLCGDENAEIIWSKSQVRTKNYKVWNRKRWNKDADRVIIERGSVFVVKLNKSASMSFFNQGIGVHKNEGFGQVIINPDFLKSDNQKLKFSLKKIEPKKDKIHWVKSGEFDDSILKMLKNVHVRNNFDSRVDQLVNQFKKDHLSNFNKISSSQWGMLRNYGKNLSDRSQFKTLVFDPNAGFLYRGQSDNDWKKNNCRVVLQEFMDKLPEDMYLPFIIKLSNQMAKK